MKIINTKAIELPRIVFEEVAYTHLLNLINATNTEIAWHGVIEKGEDNIYYVKDILVYPQLVTSVTVESDDDAYPKWISELPDAQFNKLRMHGHSHVNMAVNPSSTDLNNFKEILTQVKDYYIFMIINRTQDIHIRLYDIASNIYYETEDIKIIRPSQNNALDEIKKYLNSKHKQLHSIKHKLPQDLEIEDSVEDNYFGNPNNYLGIDEDWERRNL